MSLENVMTIRSEKRPHHGRINDSRRVQNAMSEFGIAIYESILLWIGQIFIEARTGASHLISRNTRFQIV
jgi:hypothetical protein